MSEMMRIVQEGQMVGKGSKDSCLDSNDMQELWQNIAFYGLLIVSGTFLAYKATQNGCSVNMGIGQFHISIDSSQN